MQITWSFELTWLLAMTLGAVVWATKINVTMDFMAQQLKEIADTIKLIQADYVPKSVMDKEIGKLELRISAAHLRIDELSKEHEKMVK